MSYDIEELELQIQLCRLELLYSQLKAENCKLRAKAGLSVEQAPSEFADIGRVGL